MDSPHLAANCWWRQWSELRQRAQVRGLTGPRVQMPWSLLMLIALAWTLVRFPPLPQCFMCEVAISHLLALDVH